MIIKMRDLHNLTVCFDNHFEIHLYTASQKLVHLNDALSMTPFEYNTGFGVNSITFGMVPLYLCIMFPCGICRGRKPQLKIDRYLYIGDLSD